MIRVDDQISMKIASKIDDNPVNNVDQNESSESPILLDNDQNLSSLQSQSIFFTPVSRASVDIQEDKDLGPVVQSIVSLTPLL